VRRKPLEVDSKWQENQDPEEQMSAREGSRDTEIAKVE
jgi:hypothetical protein